tara:strand:+ start:313 stop:693 length:381 start_codon:yes stop_codon:yes gene_type:complete
VERSDTGGTRRRRNVDDASTVERAATTTENETAHDAATHESEDERATKIYDGDCEDAERKSRRDETQKRRWGESNRRTERTTEFAAARRDTPKRKRERERERERWSENKNRIAACRADGRKRRRRR